MSHDFLNFQEFMGGKGSSATSHSKLHNYIER